MAELSSLRRNKITLSDYDYKKDIENRLLMAQFSSLDLELLEEILYSSIKIPIKKIAKNLDIEEEKLLPLLHKLSQTGLFIFEEDAITVDKEIRKYFETQVLKFDPEFKAGMEFLQSLLRKVPIHILPIWYSIPRTSNNIFDSLLEKYLLTPQLFQRYLMDLEFSEPRLYAIVEEVYNSPHMRVSAKHLVEKFNLSKEEFEELLLLLEFHFVCCLGYQKTNGGWEEIVQPFHEWQEYTTHLINTVGHPIQDLEKIQQYRPNEFSFIEDMTHLLILAKKYPITLEIQKERVFLPEKNAREILAEKMQGWTCDDPSFLDYLERLYMKVKLLKLADIVDGRLYALESANDWIEMRVENRSMYLYRHPLNRLISSHLPANLVTDRNIREAEKSILRVLETGWVLFDTFIQGVIVSLSEDSVVMLKKQGKHWKYSLPTYKEEELALIKETVLNWLFEAGITAIGKYENQDCFCVTPFGQSIFRR